MGIDEYNEFVKNKNLPLIIGGVLVLGVIAYILLNRGASPLSNADPESAIKNALSGTGSVKCEYTDDDGRLVTAYVKGEKMRTDVTGGQEGNGSMIFKDNTSWSWDNTTKKGVMFKAPEVTGTESDETSETELDVEDSEDIKEEIEQYKESCKNENVPDSMFEPPTDVTFQDFSQMMNNPGGQVPAEYQQYLDQ